MSGCKKFASSKELDGLDARPWHLELSIFQTMLPGFILDDLNELQNNAYMAILCAKDIRIDWCFHHLTKRSISLLAENF